MARIRYGADRAARHLIFHRSLDAVLFDFESGGRVVQAGLVFLVHGARVEEFRAVDHAAPAVNQASRRLVGVVVQCFVLERQGLRFGKQSAFGVVYARSKRSHHVPRIGENGITGWRAGQAQPLPIKFPGQCR